MQPSVYALEALRHGYDGQLVLDVSALEVRPGETLAVVGPSGAGKSTLLRLLQFLEAPSAGVIRFCGDPLSYPVPLETRRRVATVFQKPLMLDRCLRENVAFGLRLRGQRRYQEPLEKLLDQLGLRALENRPARLLSGGEAQRAALARAVAVAPDVLLLDEPAANLDPGNVALVERVIQSEKQRGATVVLVTHNIFQARRLADRTAVLLEGHLIEVGPTTTVLDTPRDPRTRAFLSGEMVY